MEEFEIDGVTFIESEKGAYKVFIKNSYKYLCDKYKKIRLTAFNNKLTDKQKIEKIKEICSTTYIKTE